LVGSKDTDTDSIDSTGSVACSKDKAVACSKGKAAVDSTDMVVVDNLVDTDS